MGRYSTGIQTTEASKRIELSYLIKYKFIVKGSKRTAQLNWVCRGEPTGNIGIETRYFGDGGDYIRLYYSITENDKKTNFDYKICLVEKESNLGKGKVLYLKCNYTGNLCRIFYMAYSSHYFKSQQAYDYRIYYPIQTRSKQDRYNSRFFELESQLEKQDKKRATYKYNGLVTKRYIKMQRLEALYERMDYLRMRVLANGLIKMGCKIDFDL